MRGAGPGATFDYERSHLPSPQWTPQCANTGGPAYGPWPFGPPPSPELRLPDLGVSEWPGQLFKSQRGRVVRAHRVVFCPPVGPPVRGSGPFRQPPSSELWRPNLGAVRQARRWLWWWWCWGPPRCDLNYCPTEGLRPRRVSRRAAKRLL